MDQKTVAFSIGEYPGGGAETVTHNLGHLFLRHGYRVIIYTTKIHTQILDPEDQIHFTLRTIPQVTDNKSHLDDKILCKYLKEDHVDFFIAQVTTSLPYAQIRRETTCKIILCVHSIPLWEVPIRRDRPSSTLSNPTFLRKMEFLLLRKPIYHLTSKLERRTMKHYASILPHLDRLIMLCPEYAAQMLHYLKKYNSPKTTITTEKIDSIYNPIPPAQAPSSDVAKEKIVLYVGRLSRIDKRVDRLLRIWQEIERTNPEWRLQILGQGTDEQPLRDYAQKFGLKNVTFEGHQTNLTPYYRKASFICLTSRFEGLPMCMIEAQQYGVIPVAFDSFAAIHSITEQGAAGLVVPAFNERKYAQILSEILRDSHRQEQMRERCYVAARKYDIEIIGAEWLRLLEAL